jgi:paraquat-inducible protein B
MRQKLNDDYRIPILIRIEPQRLISQFGGDPNVDEHITELMKRGLRAALKTGNIVTGALYVDLDFYQSTAVTDMPEFGGYRSFRRSAAVWRRSSKN